MASRDRIRDLYQLEGKVACVTGASGGLGQQAATVLAAAGVSVVGVARREDKLQAWRREAQGNTAYVLADLGDREGLKSVAEQVAEPFGAPDILVNAAGLNTRQPADEITAEAWNATMDINLAAPFFLAQALVPAMQAKGWGRIVNFASLQSFRAFPAGLSYGASKGGVAQMTRAMAEVWSAQGVNCNALGPGFFRTELTAAVFADPERAARNAAQTCVGRNGEVADMDGALLFFCSEASAFVSGQLLMVDGGFTAK